MASSEKKYSPKKFLIVFSLSGIILLLCIGAISYIVDPFFQFRVNTEGRYILNPRFVNGGLAKHYDYNTVFLGSSMLQNFDMAVIRDNFSGTKPVKLSSGGMNITEMLYLYSYIRKDDVDNLIINIDLPLFSRMDKSMRYPRYLYEDNILNKLKYLYGYETLIQYVPADIGMTLYFQSGKDIPLSYKMKTDIDNIGSDSFEVEYSAENVKKQYLAGRTVSYQILDSMKYRMHKRLDDVLNAIEIDKNPNIQYTFLFPSYSGLYLYHTQIKGYYREYMDFVYHFRESVEKYENVRIAFFLDRDEIADLNYYSDITHFGPALSDSISVNIFNPTYELNASNIDYKVARVDSLVNSFAEKNKSWLPTQ